MAPLWVYVLVGGVMLIAAVAVLAPTGVNDWLNDHRWFLPAVSFLLVLVIALIVGGFSNSIHHDQISACERSNPEKVTDVEDLKDDRAFLRSFRSLARQVLPPGEQHDKIVNAATLIIQQKSETLGKKVASRAQYSIDPGGEPAKAVVIDCNEAYSAQ